MSKYELTTYLNMRKKELIQGVPKKKDESIALLFIGGF
jgi:hypothetical protein